MQILLAEEMRALDRAAEEEIGIPGLVLMENAGQRRRPLAPQPGRGGDPGPGLCGRRTVRQRGG